MQLIQLSNSSSLVMKMLVQLGSAIRYRPSTASCLCAGQQLREALHTEFAAGYMTGIADWVKPCCCTGMHALVVVYI